MNDLNVQAFQELNAEELTSVDGGFFVHPSITARSEERSIVLNPADRGRTWGPVQPVSRIRFRWIDELILID